MHYPFLFKKAFFLVILVMLMTSIGARGFNARWVAHELEHDGTLALVKSIDHSHAHAFGDTRAQNQGEESLSDAEHQFLHAASLFEPSAILTSGGVSVVHASLGPPAFVLHAAPPSKPERTFRPPRSTSIV